LISSYRIVHSLVHATIALLCYQLLSHPEIFGTLSATLAQSTAYQNPLQLAAVGILTVLFRISDKISRFLIESVPLLSVGLRKVLSGSRFCEGDWPLIVVDTATKQLIYLGFATVTYKGDQIVIAGRDWKLDGGFALDFTSMQARYDDNKLQYWYVQRDHTGEMRGYTEMYFFPADARPGYHTGRFLDEKHANVRFYGRRIPYRWTQHVLGQKVIREKDRIAAAQQLWEDFKPHLEDITARPISASWEL
jgi:hypothetical protein